MKKIKNFLLEHYLITSLVVFILSIIIAFIDWPIVIYICYSILKGTASNKNNNIFNSNFWNALVALFSYYALLIALFKDKIQKIIFCPILEYNMKIVNQVLDINSESENEEDNSKDQSAEIISYYFEVSNKSQYIANNCRMAIRKILIMKDNNVDNWQEIPGIFSISCKWDIEDQKIIYIPRGHSGYLKIFEIKNSLKTIIDSKEQTNDSAKKQKNNNTSEERKIEHSFPLLNNISHKLAEHNIIFKLCLNADNFRPENIYIKIYIKTYSNKILKDNKIQNSNIEIKIISEKEFLELTSNHSRGK